MIKFLDHFENHTKKNHLNTIIFHNYLISAEKVIFCISVAEHRQLACPLLLKQNVRAIRTSFSGRKSMSSRGLRLGRLNAMMRPLATQHARQTESVEEKTNSYNDCVNLSYKITIKLSFIFLFIWLHVNQYCYQGNVHSTSSSPKHIIFKRSKFKYGLI